MAENSKIEWTKHSANAWWGCSKVHKGCDNCYAETLSKRWGFFVWGKTPRREIKSFFTELARFQKLAHEAGEQHTVFIGSMMDIFEKSSPLTHTEGKEEAFKNTGSLRHKLFEKISNQEYPALVFLFLTKRPSNINRFIPTPWLFQPPDNVMFGTSVSDQETANRLIPQLLQVMGRKFISLEPMLAPVQLHQNWLAGDNISDFMGTATNNISWVICGGESGPHKRPFQADWARQVRNDCDLAGVPFFMKQIDKKQPIPADLLIRQLPSFKIPAWQA